MLLIGRDASINIYFGGSQAGAANYGSANNLTPACDGLLKSFDMSDDLELSETTAFSDCRVRHRSVQGMSQVNLDMVVDNQYSCVDNYGTFLGIYAKVIVKPNSNVANTFTLEGVITRWESDITNHEVTEKITIMCDGE